MQPIKPITPAAMQISPPLGAPQDEDSQAKLGAMTIPTLETANARPMLGGGSLMAADLQNQLLGGPMGPLNLAGGPGSILSLYV